MSKGIAWWIWSRAQQALDGWIRSLIGEGRAYSLRFDPKAGASFVDWHTKEVVIDPTMVNDWGGEELLPLRWREYKVRTLGQLQWHTSRAIARHEAAHVLFTESWNVKGGTHKWLTNSLEDGRIERALGRLYPWCWFDFVQLGRLIWNQMPIDDEHPRLQVLNACLLHRWDVPRVRPSGTEPKVAFANADAQSVWDEKIRPLVEESWYAPTCARVADIASEILEILDIAQGDNRMARSLPMPIDSGAGEHRAERSYDDPVVVMPMPDPAEDDHASEDEADTGEPGAAGVPPAVDDDPSDGTRLMQPYQWLEREVLGDARRLAQQLKPPAPDTDVRPSASRGKFDVRSYVRSQGETPLVQRRETSFDPRGMAIVLLVDETGSMGGTIRHIDAQGRADGGFHNPHERMPHVRKAVMLLERTCARADIPLSIGLAARHLSLRHYKWTGGRPAGVNPTQSVCWLRTWQTSHVSEGPRALIAGMYGHAGEEAVSESLRIAQRQLDQRQEPTKVIIYLHDGLPVDESPGEVAATVQQVRASGIHVLGVFAGDQRDIGNLQAIFGNEDTLGVADMKKLPDRLGMILRRYWNS